MAPRGRPRKLVDDSIVNSPASSRASSSRRSARLAPESKPSPTQPRNGTSTLDEDIHTLSDLLSPGEPNGGNTKTQMGKHAPERASLSSSTTTEDANSTGYSTPATSAFATPSTEAVPKIPATRRGRPRTSAAAMSSVETTSTRANTLRESIYSLDRGSKRKRLDSDDEDDIESNDAKIARQLQDEEVELAGAVKASKIKPTPRSTRRVVSKISYVADSESDDDDLMDWVPRPASNLRSKKLAASASTPVQSPFFNQPKIELGAAGSNEVKFSTTSKKTTKKVVPDSDDTDSLGKINTDSESEARPLASVSRSTTRSQAAAPALHKLKTSSRKSGDFKAPAQPAVTSTQKPKSSADLHFENELVEEFQALISPASLELSSLSTDSDFDDEIEHYQGESDDASDFETEDDGDVPGPTDIAAPASNPRRRTAGGARRRVNLLESRIDRRGRQERARLELHHPELHSMWKDLENLPKILSHKAEQPTTINRELKPFQLEGLSWMKAMEETEWGGGLLGDEMGMGKTIQAVSLIMSDWPAKMPSLVLIPPVALMQWQQEIADYTDGTLKTFVFHGQNSKTKTMTKADLMKYNVILMSYNSLESMYRKQEKGFKRKDGLYKEKSVIHQIQFHRVILDEAHNIKQRTTGCAKACFALKADHKWCLSGTPLQNRIGEFFSLIRFLDIRPFACYFCKQCPCSTLNWDMNADNRCTTCGHSGMQHVSVFNQELLNPIQKFGNKGAGKEAFRKLRLLTDRFMLRRVKRDHSAAMELPAKEIYVDRQFFGEEENDFAGSIMNNGTRKFETYVAQGVLLNNYANIFGLIMQMRQVADHPDLILKKNTEGGQNILVCCICDETAEEAIRSACKHEFCRECAKNYLNSSESPDCPQCHIPLSIDLEQPDIEQDEQLVKKSSIINRIKMENWTSSSKIEALVHDLHELRSKNSSTKSIIFSQFTTMLQLVEWRLRRAGITTVLLDGSMTPAQRQSSINHFMTNVNVECFLVSLKAGGVALNLTEASRVFIVDPWWNPAAEWQSADRCHRIGQARPCSITRLCIEDSVESRMVLLQEKKANMINSTINADESAMESLTPEDMQFLFRGT
ncbi:p-loop containing nucleoside triphosphate hydrolase-7 [Coleophoma cylindrospora]|uniref:p-loop containing nucleoside triphosphate hydrolase-7 n=1 Tax=Coleophoma cylindrospora TaxID=1849047 RepID=A0A3D8R110_9HELO|nr:p-loop containing nucleoside triphosphate hydrolase-7 [Coleophoma cylindrospora]